MVKEQKRDTWISIIDYLKALAICLVVVNHSLPVGSWVRASWSFFFVVRMAVPIFVLISGYNFAMGMQRADSIFSWYAPKRLARKLRTYLLPMLAVYLLWVILHGAVSHFDLWEDIKALILQSYGSGSYYFWIIVQLYLMFPLLYWLMRKSEGGVIIILIFNVLYEILLHIFPIPSSLYRIIALRYTMLLASGCWVYLKATEDGGKIVYPWLQTICFILGCGYIAFYRLNWENTDIFKYIPWESTNVFSCLYIAPLFYATLVLFRDRRIRIGWIHQLISSIGQSSYYILCTQMVLFWGVWKLWGWAEVPLSASIVCNVILATVSGVFVQWLVNRSRKVIHERHFTPCVTKNDDS